MKKFSFLFAAFFAAMSMFAADATITKGTNGYDDFTINGSPAVKIGTSSKGGDLTVTVGAGATSLSLHAVAWKGVSGLSLNITAPTGVTITPASISLTASDVIQGSDKVFTLDNADDFKFDFAISGADEGATFTFTTSIAKRFIMWDATYEVGGTPAPVVEYYLVGTMNSWVPAEGYKFSKNTAAEGEEYKLDVTLEANAEFKGRKVVDGEADAWYPDNCLDCNFTVATAGDYTIYLRPNGDGGDDWHYHVLYAEYHEPVELPTITCAEVNTADGGTEAKLNAVSVVYVGENDNRYCYVADESGMTLLYKTNLGLEAGKLVSGIEGAVTVYNQLHEFVPSNTIDDWTVTDEGVIPTFAEQTTAPAANQENQIIVLKGVFVDNTVTFSTTSVGSNVTAHIGEADFQMRNTFKVGMTLEQGKLYDVTGAVSRYNSTIQFIPISAEEETVDPGTVEYYLAGWIGGAYYAYDEDVDSPSEYKFVNNRIVVNFDEEAYLLVRTYENTPKFYGADDNVESEEENFEAVLADGGEGMVTIPAYREATIQISLDESGAMTMSVALAHSYTCAEVNAAAHDEVINLNPATVAYLGAGDNRYCYLSDESGMTLLYKNGHGLEEGQLVSGLKGKLNIYNGLPELVPTNTIDNWTIGVGTMPEYAELTEAPGVEMVNQIVVLKNVSVAEDVTFTADAVNNANATIAGATIKLRNTFKVTMTLEASKMYDLTVAVARYAKNETDEIQFFPIAAVEVETPVVQEHYYIVGGFTNNWSLADAIEFQDVEGVLTANVPALSGGFKIVKDRSWNPQWGKNNDLGGLVKDEPYILAAKTDNWEPANLTLANPFGSYNNAVLTLAKDESGAMVLTLVDGEFAVNEQDWYVPGQYLGWNCNEATKMTRLEGDEDIYEIQLPEFGERFKVVYGNWMVEYGAVSDQAVDGWFFDGEMELVSPCHDIHCTYGDTERYANVTIQIEVDYENAGVILRMTREEPCEPAYQIKAGEQTIDLVANPENETEVMALDIELQAGTQFKLFEVCSEAEFTAVTNDGYQFEIVEGAYVVAEDGIYSFYLAPAYQNDRLYVSKYMGPTSKAADPEWPALQVKAVYSDTYDADCNFGWWDSYTTYEQTEYGKHFTTTERGYFGLEFGALNCSNMESFHMDVWPTEDMTLRIVPIHGGVEQGVTVNLTAGQWNGVEADLNVGDWANVEDWSNVYQIKIDNAPNRSFWLDNVYFYTSQAPEEDHDAPTGLQAQVVAESYFSAVIEAVAEDNSGEVVYSVVNGGLMIASASGNSGVPVQITVKELQGGDEYHFNVVARDPQGNDAEPVEVTVHTLATPDPAPQPEYAAEDVMSLYSAYYNQAVEFGYQDWYMGATQSEGDLAQNNFAMCYVPKDVAGACFGWSFAATDITAYDRFEMDVYAVEDGALDFALIDATPRAVHQLVGGQWNHIVIDIAGNEKTNLEQLGFYDNQNSGTFFVQNAMFVKEPVVYNYFMVGDFCDWDLANAVMFEDVEGVLAAMIPSMTGKFKIVKCAGEAAQWGDEFGAHTQGDVIALNPQGEYILKHNNSKDLNVEGRYNNAVFTLTESEGEMVLHFVAGTVDENIYFSIAGDFNNWNNNDDNATFAVVEDKLRLEFEEIHGEFKVVVKGDWHPQAGGPVGAEEKDVLPLGEAYNMTLALVEGQPDASNLLFAPVGYGYHNAVIELTADLSTATVSITLVSGDIYDLPTDVYYMAGEAVGWNPTAAKFEEVEGVLTLEVADFWGDFKLTAGAWHPQYGAPVGVTTDSIKLGVPYQLTMCDDSQGEADIENVHTALEEDYRYADAKFTLEVAEDGTLTITLVEGTPYDHSGAPKTYQIVGGFTNNWSAADAIDFEEVEGVLTATVEDLNGTFKIIQDHAWTNQWATNWETGARLGFNEPYVLGAKTETAEPANLALVNLFGGYHNAVLTLDPETMTLTLVDGEPYRVEADWYVPGAWQDPEWKCNDYSKMSPVEGQENTYEILLPEFGKAFKVVYGQWMVEFGAAVGSGATWMLDQDIELANPCDNLNSAYGDQMLQDVTITIVVDYENGAVSLNITSEGEVQPTVYYIKNNWNGGEWEWMQMTPSNNGDEWMFEGVFGGTGVNINTSMSDEGAIWFPVGEAYEGHVIEGDAIEAGQTVRFVYSVSAGTLTATIIETGIENVVLDAVKAQKMLIDGHIYIIRDGRMFNVQGARVR